MYNSYDPVGYQFVSNNDYDKPKKPKTIQNIEVFKSQNKAYRQPPLRTSSGVRFGW